MSFSSVRHAFSTASRASLRTAWSKPSTARIGARMNSSHAAPKSSDKPWIIVSGLIFGPAFLYLLSPSARKKAHFTHDDAHDFPGHKAQEHAKEAKAVEPVIVKDDEGTEANVAGSLQQAEAAGVPKAAGAEAAEPEPASGTQNTETEPEAEATEAAAEKKVGTYQAAGESGPTDLGEASKAATAGIEPKTARDAVEGH